MFYANYVIFTRGKYPKHTRFRLTKDQYYNLSRFEIEKLIEDSVSNECIVMVNSFTEEIKCNTSE